MRVDSVDRLRLSTAGPTHLQQSITTVQTYSYPAQHPTMDPMMVKEQSQDEQYGGSQWVDINDYHSPHVQSPATEYNSFGYMASSHGVPIDSAYNRPMHSTYSMNQPQHPIITTQWPSMLTNPSSNAPLPAPIPAPPPLAPISTFATIHSLPPLTTPVPTASARRTLTDQDRRRMCLYHEENPTVKQTEIGGAAPFYFLCSFLANFFAAMFGVERRSFISSQLLFTSKASY